MKIVHAEFVKSAVKWDDYPKLNLPQITFVGRSNVGKSSLINTLCGVKGMAKISSTPGKTRTINFYLINNSFYFVDLPGYGYAKVPKNVRLSWQDMITEYFRSKSKIIASILIVDCRRELAELDFLMLEWFRFYKIRTIVIMTKIDKLKRGQLLMQKQKIVDKLPDVHNNDFILFSAKTGTGKVEILKSLTHIIES